MAVYQREVRFYFPTEGAMSLLTLMKNQMCAGCPISVGGEPPDPVIEMQLYFNDIELVDATEYGDLGVAAPGDVAPVELNTEAAPGYCDGHIEGPSVDVDDIAKLIFDQAIFEALAGFNASGVVIRADFGDGNVIVAVGRFTPIVPVVTGDLIKVTGALWLPAVVPLEA